MLLPLSRLAFLLLLMAYTGCTVVSALTGLAWRRPEVLGLGFMTGVVVNAFLLFCLNWLGVPLSYGVNVLSLVLVAIALTPWSLRNRYPVRHTEPPGSSRSRLRWWDALHVSAIVAAILLVILLLWTPVWGSLVNPYTSSDEFSYWGTASRAIYLQESVDLRGSIPSGFREHPPLVPLTAASIALALGQFAENYTRLVACLPLISLVLVVYGMGRRLNLGMLESLLFVILMLTSGRALTTWAMHLYSDLPFAALFAGATVGLMLIPSTPRPRGMALVSGLLFGAAAFTRTEGLYVVVASLAVLALVDYATVRRSAGDFVALCATAVAPSVLWRVFLWRHPWPEATPQVIGILADPSIWVSLRQRAARATPSMIRQLLDVAEWSGIWVITSFAVATGLVRYRSDRSFRILVSFAAVQVGFYWVSYLVFFRFADSLGAPGFARYALHFLPLAILLNMTVYARIGFTPRRG